MNENLSKNSIFRNQSNNEIVGISQKIYEVPKMLKLSKAVLCINCETIFERKEKKIGTSNNYCPGCGSNTTVFISKFLNRSE